MKHTLKIPIKIYWYFVGHKENNRNFNTYYIECIRVWNLTSQVASVIFRSNGLCNSALAAKGCYARCKFANLY